MILCLIIRLASSNLLGSTIISFSFTEMAPAIQVLIITMGLTLGTNAADSDEKRLSALYRQAMLQQLFVDGRIRSDGRLRSEASANRSL